MEKINIAMIGIGYWGPNILRNFNNVSGVSIKYICDLHEKKFDKFSKVYPNTIFTKKIEDIIEDKSVDAVAIATDVKTHYELAEKALLSGKHVFIEKPLTLECEEAEKLIKLAKEKDKKIMVGHLLLYHPAVNFLKTYIQDGELGDIRYIYSSRLNLGKVRSSENAFWSLAPHDISVILHLIGDAPFEVNAYGESYLRDNIEDVVFCYLKFNNNIMAHIHTSWLDPHKVRKMTVVGTKKMVVFDDMESVEKIRIYNKTANKKHNFETYDEEYISIQSGDISIPKISNVEPLFAECSHFIECIRENREPVSNGEEGLRVLRVLEDVGDSLKTCGQNGRSGHCGHDGRLI